ncbi:MAG: hypothetical protein WAO24_07265 [Peptococcia bacterium]
MKKVAFLLVVALLMMCTAIPVPATDVYLTSLRINEDLVPGPNGQTLTVTGILSNGVQQRLTGNLIWRSSDYDIATVSTSGRVHFTGKGGTVTISVSRGAVVGTKTVHVKPWPVSVDIETSLVYSQNPYRLLVKGKFSDGQERYFGSEDNLVWDTTNPFVAWVNSQGVVTFTGEPGYVQIKASWGDLYDWAVVTVPDTGGDGDVTIPAYRIGIKIKEEEIEYSEEPITLSLVARLVDGTEQELPNVGADWSSSNPAVATINNEGELKFTGKQGITEITVKYGGFTYTRLITVGRFLQSLKINQSLNYTPDWEGVPLQLTVRGKYNDGSELPVPSGSVTWAVDNNKVAEITTDGLLTFTGEAGTVVVSAKAPGYSDTVREDSVTVNVPDYPKAQPQRFFIANNIHNSDNPLEPKAYCIYDDGSLKEVTEQTQFYSLTPDRLSVYQNKFYIAPNPGRIGVRASYKGLSDELSGFVNATSAKGNWVQQVFIREHNVAFTYRPVKLAALAVMSDGTIRDVTANVRWSSNQPLVAKISKGVLTFTGRTGRAVITMQGYGFRDQLILEVTPAELKPRVEKLEIVGSLTKDFSPLKAIATFNDGTVKDVSAEAVWNTNNREYVAVFQGDVIFSQGLKPVTVTVNYGRVSAQISRN